MSNYYSVYPTDIEYSSDKVEIKLFLDLKNKNVFKILKVKYCKVRKCFAFDIPKKKFPPHIKIMRFIFIINDIYALDPAYQYTYFGDDQVNFIDFKLQDIEQEQNLLINLKDTNNGKDNDSDNSTSPKNNDNNEKQIFNFEDEIDKKEESDDDKIDGSEEEEKDGSEEEEKDEEKDEEKEDERENEEYKKEEKEDQKEGSIDVENNNIIENSVEIPNLFETQNNIKIENNTSKVEAKKNKKKKHKKDNHNSIKHLTEMLAKSPRKTYKTPSKNLQRRNKFDKDNLSVTHSSVNCDLTEDKKKIKRIKTRSILKDRSMHRKLNKDENANIEKKVSFGVIKYSY